MEVAGRRLWIAVVSVVEKILIEPRLLRARYVFVELATQI